MTLTTAPFVYLAMAIPALVIELARAAGAAAVDRVVDWLRRKPPAPPDPEESHPLTYRDVEHIRAQERASIDASKRAAITTRPPGVKPGKLPR